MENSTFSEIEIESLINTQTNQKIKKSTFSEVEIESLIYTSDLNLYR